MNHFINVVQRCAQPQFMQLKSMHVARRNPQLLVLLEDGIKAAFATLNSCRLETLMRAELPGWLISKATSPPETTPTAAPTTVLPRVTSTSSDSPTYFCVCRRETVSNQHSAKSVLSKLKPERPIAAPTNRTAARHTISHLLAYLCAFAQLKLAMHILSGIEAGND